MNDERFECACRALHDQLISLDHVQHLHPSIRIVRHDIREPMAAGLDELVLVQAGPFLSPSVSLGDHLHLVDQVGYGQTPFAAPIGSLSNRGRY